MVRSRTAEARRGIGTLYGMGTIGNLGDGQLLERFATERGEGAELAFAALVERHGPMVLRVCHSVLSDWHDTEDAFQATFLVLVKKARRLWVRDSVGPWLHQVAVRTAAGARIAAVRRRRCDRQTAVAPIEEPRDPGDDVLALLHEEIERMPERFRLPLVLCDLEECSHQQAARHLGWPIGTVKSRLARGRERLRDRLTRRGLAPDAGFMVAAIRHDARLALRLPALIDSTARAVVQCTPGRVIGSGSISALAHGALRTTIVSRWIGAGALVVAVGAAGAGGRYLLAERAQQPGDTPTKGAANERAAKQKLPDEFPTGTIAKIQFEGTNIPAETLKQILMCGVGQALNRERLEADLKKLLGTKWFSQATYSLDEMPRKSGKWTVEFSLRDRTEASVQRGNLHAVVSEPGIVVRANSLYAINGIEGQSVISWILPEGTAVKKGDLVCQLDSGALENQLKMQAAVVESAEKAFQDAKASSDAAQAALNEYEAEKPARESVMKALQAHVEDQKANESAQQASWDDAKAKEATLKRQRADLTLRAPTDGIVVHANDTSSRFNNRINIANGATVRERQVIFKMSDLKSPVRVTTHLPAWSVPHVAGAKVRISAEGGRVFTGRVSEIAPLPDPLSRFDTGGFFHRTQISLDDPPPYVVTDMNVRVEIDVADLENVLTVPVRSVISFQGKDHVAVRKPAGELEWREVTLGLSDGVHFEVKKGIQSGEVVMLEPAGLLPGEGKFPISRTPPAATNRGLPKK